MTSEPGTQPRRERRYRLRALIPNMLTIMALCAGLSGVRYAMDGRFELAAGLIILAATLDALDGRSARFLNSQSKLGAELDSFADSISCGVAPAMMVYLWTLHTIPGMGWAVVLLFATCCVLRLARFNAALDDEDVHDGQFFTGVPAPAAAGCAITPMLASFSLDWAFLSTWWLNAGLLVFIAAMMVSPVPTLSLKKLRVSRSRVLPVLVGVAALVACLAADFWLTFSVIGVCYVLLIPISARWAVKARANRKTSAEASG